MAASVRMAQGTSLSPTAIRMVELSILRPMEGVGNAFSHFPDSGVDEAARRWAWEEGLSALFSRP